MSDLTAFLLARIGEDEESAREAATWEDGMYFEPWQAHIPQAGYFNSEMPYGAVEFSAARVLAECEAKRRIVEEHRESYAGSKRCEVCAKDAHLEYGDVVVDWVRFPCPTMRLLALPYADHPDYRQEWTP
jgi:hypothetical protein